MRPIRLAGAPFDEPAESARGGPIDWSRLEVSAFPEAQVELARRVWASRAQSELRSVQIMTRFLDEVLGAGDPLDVAAWASDLIRDEVRHTLLCKEACEALGGRPAWPEPLVPELPPAYRAAPMADRALTTAISMLAINETISVGFIEDLARRCDTPGLSEVLRRTIEDEAEHGDLGWGYVRASLARYPESTLPSWRHLVATSLEPHRAAADRTLDALPAERRRLEAQPEPELAALGLLSPVRQALVFEKTWAEALEPRLRAHGLLGSA